MAYISNAVPDKDCRCRAALLGGPCNVGHADTDDQTDHRSKEANNGVASNGGGSSMGPAASPDHCTASDHWEAAKDQKNEADVGYPAGEVSCQENEDENNAAEWELKEDRVKGRPAVVTLVSKVLNPHSFPKGPTQTWTQ